MRSISPATSASRSSERYRADGDLTSAADRRVGDARSRELIFRHRRRHAFSASIRQRMLDDRDIAEAIALDVGAQLGSGIGHHLIAITRPLGPTRRAARNREEADVGTRHR